MARGIFHVELGGKRRLGFDTGLNAQAFAQAKLAQFITQEGHIVLPDGTVKSWQPGGVIESEGTMVVWGPDFEGERFDLLLSPGREDLALEALRYWLAACPLVSEAGLWPVGLFVVLGAGGSYPLGTVFFPPERLRCRCIQAEAVDLWLDGGESLVFQDLTGKAAFSFTAGAMLYRIFAHAAGGAFLPEAPVEGLSGPARPDLHRSDLHRPVPERHVLGPPVLEQSGALPFPSRNPEKLHQDMREGVFLPLGLAAPGLDSGIAGLADRAIAGLKGQQASRPSLEEFAELLGPPAGTSGSGDTAGAGAAGRRPASFFRELSAREREKLREERERYEKKRNLTVGTRRFLVRNTAIISGIAAALAVVILFTSSMVSSHRSLPTTAGMDSLEVLESYYGAFATLDHTLMEACVINKAGKGDIDMITRYFVTSRVRQAYEFSSVMVSAQDWFAAGAPPTTAQVLGVTDLNITWLAGDEADDQIRYRADYIIWLPGGDEDSGGIVAVPGPAPEPAPASVPDAGFGGTGTATVSLEDFIPPRGYPLIDDLTLIRHKGNWRISNIDRQEK
ncbi:MAG: hypothetical protein LBD96_07175 [Treponema sp.]|jgi:hypothetical protein|nr:hypothetical protein [Treponema sp.]